MYLRTRDTPAPLPTSYWYDSSINGLGETSRKPVLLTHYHVRKTLDPKAGLLADSKATVMSAAQMTPNFVGVTDPRRISMQKEMEKLVQGKYLAARSPKLHFRIALVDLTDVKHRTPIFAGASAFGPGNTVEGDSLPKILALYSLYQLRFDLNTFAALNGINKPSALQVAIAQDWKKAGLQSQPNLGWLFDIPENAGRPVVAGLKQAPQIHENWYARALILALGFEYIGSVALQSGLFDERWGGLWLNAAYQFPAVTWRSSPFPTLPRHSVSALSAATFFTLMAQGRLVDQASSNEIASVLKSVQCMSGGLLDGVKHLPGAPTASPNKCGLVKPRYHEAIHVSRQVSGGKRLEYVAAVLSEEPPPLDFTELGRNLDSIIARQNP